MVRVSRKAKAESNARIVEVAAQLFRENGIDNTAVGDVMKAAGLTHGGFYRHFASKDELVSTAIGKIFERITENLKQDIARSGPRSAIDNYIDQYLSTAHKDSPGAGCPIAAFASDVSRGSPLFKKAMADGMGQLTDILSKALADASKGDAQSLPAEGHARATRLLAVLLGSLVQARMAPSEKVAQDILSAGHALAQESLAN